MNLQPLTSYAICHILDYDDKKEIYECIQRISTKIQSRTNPLDMEPINFYNFAKMKYIDACCWLINEIHHLIANIPPTENCIVKKYVYDFEQNEIECLSLISVHILNTNILKLPECCKYGDGNAIQLR